MISTNGVALLCPSLWGGPEDYKGLAQLWPSGGEGEPLDGIRSSFLRLDTDVSDNSSGSLSNSTLARL